MTRASDTAKLLGAGATILDGTTISTADNTDQLILKSTDADANVGPVLRLNRDSGSPADNDLIGSIIFQADDDGGNTTNLVEFITQIEDASNGSESADLHIKTRRLGSLVSRIGMYNSTTVINEDSADIDFRVESNGNANMLFVEANADRVAIGHNAPTAQLHVAGSGQQGIGIGSTNAGGAYLYLDGDSNGDLSGSDYSFIGHDTAGRLNIHQNSPSGTNQVRISTAGTERLRIFSGGQVGIADGTTPESAAMLDVKRNSGDIVYFRNNGGTGVKLTAGNQSFSAVSDENKKENIVELNKQHSYDNVKNIRAVTYNFKDIVKVDDDDNTTTYEDDKSRIGFISQDWETNYSELVDTDDDGVKSLLYTETVPVLLSALQKAQDKIEAMEARITALESA